MALDLDIQQYLVRYSAQRFPPYSSYTPAGLRKHFNYNFSKNNIRPLLEVERVERVLINNGLDSNPLQCRAYYPNGVNKKALPVLMYFHGGGFVIRDDMDLYDNTCRMISSQAGCVVIAVDFSLSPEKPFPNALEECYRATCWVSENGKALGVDPHNLGVCGESCGGNLATVVTMLARDRCGPNICYQIIITGMLDYDFTTTSYKENGRGEYFLTEDTMKWFWKHYFSNKRDDTANPYCVPLQAKNLTNLPQALVVTVEFDPLRDEGEKYAEYLENDGVDTKYICYPGLIHGFFDLSHISKGANEACYKIIEFITEMQTSFARN
jgi:acetyl esterase